MLKYVTLLFKNSKEYEIGKQIMKLMRLCEAPSCISCI